MLKILFWDAGQKRLRTLWRLVLQAVFTALLALAPIVVIGESLSAAQKRGMLPLAFTGVIGDKLLDLIVGPLFAVLIIASVWLAGRLLDRRHFADFGLHLSRAWWSDLCFGFGLGAVLMGLIFLVEWAAGWVTIQGTFQVSVPGLPLSLALVYVLVKDVCVGIYEELLSHGYQLKNMAEWFKGLRGTQAKPAILLATLVSSVIFGLLHAANANTTPLSLFLLCLNGGFLVLGYILTGELAIPIGLHIAWNFFQGSVFGFPVSGDRENAALLAIQQGGPALMTGGAFGPEAGLLGLAAMLLGSLLIVIWVRWRYRHPGLHEKLTIPELTGTRPEAH
jgi:membrane protease YdiL (CAAX protease family)